MTHRKHWYSRRAWLDGWKIARYHPFHEIWILDESPAFYNNHEYRVVPDPEGWLPVYDPQPINIPGGHKLENKTIGGILYYHIIKEADPYAELKAAAKDPTKQIRHLGYNSDGEQAWSDWVSHKDTSIWSWKLPINNYEIRDKPKTKKVKLLAWITDSGTFFRAIDGTYVSSVWKRVPSEDKEIEVEF